MLMFTEPEFTLSIFAAFFEVHKTSDLNGIRSSGIAPRRREYKWRAPGVKNPSKNVARRVKDICFAVERLGRALYTRGRTSYSFHLVLFFASVYKSGTNRRRRSAYIAREIVAYLIEKLFSLQRGRLRNERHGKTTRGKIVKGSREIKRAGKCFIACPTHLPRLNERRPPSRC